MSELVVSNLTQRYGDVRAIDDVSFRIADGELLTLLGPSGCGKSTTLFSIAGLNRPDGGQIRVGANVLFDAQAGIHRPPEARNCGLVFQSYALWPHMTVRENVMFPLKLRKVTGRAALDKARWALSLVEMEPLLDRYPHELSGGQQQRVALARTLVYEPQVLLLDEPLSNLDAKLRLRARGWLRELQTKLRLTTLYVTHDQDEALALSDRIAVMNGGKIIQLGTPREIYGDPRSPFIADFVGHSNILLGRPLDNGDGSMAVVFADEQRLMLASGPIGTRGGEVQVAIRPEHITLTSAAGAAGQGNVLAGNIIQKDFLGTRFEYLVAVGGATLRVVCPQEMELGEVHAVIPQKHCMAFWSSV